MKAVRRHSAPRGKGVRFDAGGYDIKPSSGMLGRRHNITPSRKGRMVDFGVGRMLAVKPVGEPHAGNPHVDERGGERTA